MELTTSKVLMVVLAVVAVVVIHKVVLILPVAHLLMATILQWAQVLLVVLAVMDNLIINL